MDNGLIGLKILEFEEGGSSPIFILKLSYRESIITSDVGVSNSEQTIDDIFSLSLVCSNDEFLVGSEEKGNPAGDWSSRRQPVSTMKNSFTDIHAGVHQLRRFSESIELVGMERSVNMFTSEVEVFRTSLVEGCIMEEVRRRFRHATQDFFGEIVLIWSLESIVIRELSTKSTKHAGSDCLSTG